MIHPSDSRPVTPDPRSIPAGAARPPAFGRERWARGAAWAVALMSLPSCADARDEAATRALADRCAAFGSRVDHDLRAAAEGGRSVFHLYLLAGQSNMVGHGIVEELPDSFDEPGHDVMIFHGMDRPDHMDGAGVGVWAPLRPGHGSGFTTDGRVNAYADRFGPELTFARRLREIDPDRRIAIVKYARGGTSIDPSAPGRGNWSPAFRTGSGVNQYDHALTTLRNALADRDIDGDGTEDVLVPGGILWMQGENDAAHTGAVADRYEDNLTSLLGHLRAALRSDDLPLVLGRISDSGQDTDGKVWDQGSTVRDAQERFVRTDLCASLVSTDGYGYSDPWHYDTEGYLLFGSALADALVTMSTPSGEARVTEESAPSRLP